MYSLTYNGSYETFSFIAICDCYSVCTYPRCPCRTKFCYIEGDLGRFA